MQRATVQSPCASTTLNNTRCHVHSKWEGVYVLYTYAAHPSTSTAVQKMLSTPEAGGESNILRHMTFRV